MTAAERRLALARELADAVAPLLGPHLALKLWDGGTSPRQVGPDKLIVRFGDEGTLAALAKSPKLDTLVRLHALGRIDLENGDLFDLAERRPSLRGRDLLRAAGPLRLARTAAAFLKVPAGETRLPWEGQPGAAPGRSGDPDDNQKNIAHHYDVSNAFYRLFLDEQLIYSCAYFHDWDEDLDAAQRNKIDLVCRKLRLQPGERFLDVGCGWGALICHAAEAYGVTAHGVTLSREQLAGAQALILERGLQGRVTVALADWSTVGGEFDKIASVGMFEHVGLKNADAYYKGVRRLLKPGGLYLHHAITRRAKRGDDRKLRPEAKAILRHIFPGAELDHIGSTLSGLERAGFEPQDVEALRRHYARTTALWCRRLQANREAAIAEAGEVRTRMWIAYLAGVSLAFARGSIGVCQTLASSRTKSGAVDLPSTRADIYRA
ncbi:cyclopropane-fatty-acyl-phospholipid synthase [Methylopila jiangsuensis]|uniref:Cyclopropane-fatty-acyl-phospholipid synthase n=1 Tax=Methylopila jiangsuensis TaxID=586230 RepID=A0A9W6JIF5_9HYPH|nr:cyclopropane-fatty-acyl-phospholipid synthase family protein [Methylopila jiangsuensis]MDR6286850.1 cyclopropane-fatty-acyl-phospholipid synthase [Methylopila jiangsuensis]GLK76803.1 cyclopropane-fatty-acyl-phospholipid synthase [Methylopila jiangsuensis]